jgi:hypothetical protein
MSNKQIGSGRLGLSVEWAIQKLEERCPKFQQRLKNGLTVKEVNIGIASNKSTNFQLVSTQVSADAGFMSYVYRVDVYFNGGTDDDTLVYCLKEPHPERMDKILGWFLKKCNLMCLNV